METVEKLLAQIFERKNRIVRQVKQQTDNYTQHLASKCLVDGITPPPWLCYDNQSSDVPKGTPFVFLLLHYFFLKLFDVLVVIICSRFWIGK